MRRDQGSCARAGPLILGSHSPYAIAIARQNIWFTEYQGSNIA